MNKFVMFFLCVAAGTMSAPAATVLRVELNDGRSLEYLLEERPRISFADADVVFTTAAATVGHPRTSVATMYFTEKTSAIEDISDDTLVMSYTDGEIRTDGRRIDLYDIEGRLVRTATGNMRLSDLARGIYIAKSDCQTIKIKK